MCPVMPRTKTRTRRDDATIERVIADLSAVVVDLDARWMAGESVDAARADAHRNLSDALAWSMRVRGY